MANALSLLRLLLAVPFGLLMVRSGGESALYAGAVFCIAIATDFLDGWLARRRGTVSALGGALDHGADCLFVTIGLAAMAWRGVIPGVLPVLVAAAFLQYVVDSRWVHRGRELRGSLLGRCNGILYFVPPGGDILVRLGLETLAPLVFWIAWILVVTTSVSIGDRLLASARSLRSARGLASDNH